MRSLPLALLFPSPVLAATITVPTDFGTLEEAVANSNPGGGDVIRLESGTYDVEVTIDRNLVIEAVTDADVTLVNTTGTSGNILDITSGVSTINIRNIHFGPSNQNRAIRSASVITIIEDVTASGLSTPGDGSFLLATDATLVNLNRIAVTGGSAANGGIIAIQSDPAAATIVELRDSTLDSGTATADGGLIWAENSDITLQDAVLGGGSATNGGGIWAENSGSARNFVVRRSSISNSVASELGGGASITGFEIDFDNASLVANIAAAGGGVWLDQGAAVERVIMDNNTLFDGNMASGGGSSADGAAGIGAAIVARQDRFTLTDVSILDSDGIGAAVWLEGDSAALTDVTVDSNTATDGAGALQIAAVTDISLVSLTANLNSSTSGAGAAQLDAPTLSVSASTFTDNTTTNGDGGALGFDNGAVDISGSLFTDNSAARGGALFRSGSDAGINLSDTRFFRNQADDGGAVWAESVTSLNLLRNGWCANSAGVPGLGGAIEASGTVGSTIQVRNDGASDNAAITGGVYHFTGFDSLDVAYSTYVNNSATTGGVASMDSTGQTFLDHVAALSSSGSAFYGTGTLTVDWSAFDSNNPDDFSGAFAGTTPADAVAILNSPVVNNHPGQDCETTFLYPAVGSDLRDVGPNTNDLNNSLADVGLSGGALADASLYMDADGDGFIALDDCDDTNPDSNPAAPDICNNIDDDCDGQLDEDPATQWFEDLDGDGYGAAGGNFPTQCDPPVSGVADNDLDCDDADDQINPDAEEVCDGIDNDCNSTIDDNAVDAVLWYEDLDFDGFGTEEGNTLACSQPPGFTDITGDCDDTFANVYPGAIENCDTLDNDCNGDIDDNPVDAPAWYPDNDHDGYGVDGLEIIQCLAPLDHSPFGGDCDDADEFRSPGATELCDGIDNDCDGGVDLNPASPVYFPDADGDGFGDGNAVPIGSCTPVSGLLEDGSDCDDADATVNPDAEENCDGVDQNCDGDIDDDPVDGNIYYLDNDGDGFGSSDFEIIACAQPNFASTEGGDCNDTNDVQFPGNDEICDSWDNDCDGDVDEPDSLDAPTWYADADDDGYGDDNIFEVACTPPIGFVPANGDCEDTNPTAHPGRAEICDGVDNDCNGTVDGADAENVEFYYADVDGDGFGDPMSELGACDPPEDYVSNAQDCDDTNAEVFPSAAEVAGNGIDEDCNGSDLPGDGGDTDTGTAPEGCGCSSSPGQLPFLLGPMLGALFMRRRR